MALPKTGTTLPNYLQPTSGKNLYGGNYLNFTDSTINQWTQQFLPDVYDKEIEIYGNRTISGFLKMVSAEMPSSSDQIIWLEQGRLHTRYADLRFQGEAADATAATSAVNGYTAVDATGVAGTAVAAGEIALFQIGVVDGRPAGSITSGSTEGAGLINFRVGQTVMIQATAGAAQKGTGDVLKGIVTNTSSHGFSVLAYTAADFSANSSTSQAYTALAYGSEFAKGTGNFTEKLDPSYTTYANSPIIMKEHYAINGSDTGQIGWVEVTSENGASGYLWYVKAEHENRLRWEDYLEMSMVEGVQANGTTGIASGLAGNTYRGDGSQADIYNNARANTARGTQGFFAALEERANVYGDLKGTLVPATAGTTNEGIAALNNTFDSILKQMDKQGAIQENMMYLDRATALAFDNFMAITNNYGGQTGASWGVFNNSKDMALDFGFTGLSRGSYDFYKTDWKYLNDFSTRGGFGDVEGVLIPAGTSTVYDQNLGKNIKRPFLHVRYRSSDTDNRKMKSWITGSVGGAYTTDIDEMRMHYLTERCLITQGANNFFLFQQGA